MRNNHQHRNYNWLIASSTTLILLAIISNHYFSSLETNMAVTTEFPLMDFGMINQACSLQMDHKKQPVTSEWIVKFNVFNDDRIEDTASFIQAENEKCRQAFLELLKEESIFPNIQPLNKFQIVLLPDTFLQSSAGGYWNKGYTIGINYRRHLTIPEYKRIIRNEYFSHQVQMHNELNGVEVEDIKLLSIPFLNMNGTIDAVRLKRLEDSLNK